MWWKTTLEQLALASLGIHRMNWTAGACECRKVFASLLTWEKNVITSYSYGKRVCYPKIRITSRVGPNMSVCPSVRMSAEISESIRTRVLGLDMQILGLLGQVCFSRVPRALHTTTNDYNT